MKDGSSRSDFENAFRTQLQDREASSGRSIVIDEVQAAEIKVAVTQEEVAATDADDATTTSTSKPSDDDELLSKPVKEIKILEPLPSTSSLPGDEAESSTSPDPQSMTTTTEGI